MHIGIDGIFYYDKDDVKDFKGEDVICSAALYGACDGKECDYYHSQPHKYDDYECFCQCNHKGKKGICIFNIQESRGA
jgi:hypothetical protein